MAPEEIKSILEAHALWLRDPSEGKRAYLRSADLGGADLGGANLRGANLWGANLESANLWGANLWGANLWGANLWGANLESADLESADLRGTNLRGAYLPSADLRGANLPSPTSVLTARWGGLPDDLVRDLMNYDAACHPSPALFEVWANHGGPCPYEGVRVSRAAEFFEDRELWDPEAPACRPYDLMARVLREKCTWDG